MKSVAELAALERHDRTRDFADTLRMLALSRGRLAEAKALAEHEGVSPRTRGILKEASAAGSFADVADMLATARAFRDQLALVGAFDTMAPAMVRVPMLATVAVVTASSEAELVDEAGEKPLVEMEWDFPPLSRLKTAAVAAVSRDFMRFSPSEAMRLITSNLRGSIARKTDAAFVAALATDAPATPATGTTVAAVRTDVAAAVARLPLDAGSRIFVLASPVVYHEMRITGVDDAPGWGDVQLVKTDALPLPGSPPARDLIVVDASRIAADPGDVLPTTSTEATIGLINLWQKNMAALRVSRTFGFVRLHADAVQVVTGTG